MKILAVTTLVDSEYEKEIASTEQYKLNTPVRLNRLVQMKGLVELGAEIDNLSYNVNKGKEQKKIIFRRKCHKLMDGINTEYFSFFTVPVLFEISIMIDACVSVFKWYNKYKKTDGDLKIYLATQSHFPSCFGLRVAAWMLKIPIIYFCDDLTEDTYTAYKKHMSKWKRAIINPYMKLSTWLENQYDGYILISEGMNKYINSKGKPFMVSEGIFSENGVDYTPCKKENYIMYAGGLQKTRGTDMMLEMFSKIDDPSLEFWVFGTGEEKEHIKEVAEKDSRIKVFDYVSREFLFECEKKAKLLLNIRNPKIPHTKRYFPSKYFEYMAAGTLVFCTYLEGLPKEYYDYVISVKDFDADILANKLKEVLQWDEKKYQDMADKAKNFIMENKTYMKQSEKIFEFLKVDF